VGFAALVGSAPSGVVGRLGVYVWGTPSTWGWLGDPPNREKMQGGGKHYPVAWFGIEVAHVEMVCY